MSGSVRGKIPEAIRDEAARWLARREGDPSAANDVAFTDWLARDLRHRLAYAEVERAWRESLHLANTRTGRDRKLVRAPFHLRRSTHVMAATLAVLLGVSLLSVQFSGFVPMIGFGNEVEARSFRTASGETRTWQLADGSALTLSGESLAQARVGGAIRQIDIEAGHARVQVARGGSQPLDVRVRALSVTTRDALLDVSADDGRGRIEVLSGHANATEGGQQSRSLGPGQAIGSPATSAKPLAATDIARPALVPTSEMTVGEAVAVLNRQNVVQIHLGSGGIADQRLSGGFRMDDPATFAKTVAIANGLEVAEAGEGIDLRLRR